MSESETPPPGRSTIKKLAFAGWCYLRDGKPVGPVSTDELVTSLFRGEVDPDSRVFRVRQKGQEYALLVPPLQPLGTICCDITPLPLPSKASLALGEPVSGNENMKS
jgi:hypothetical protein